MDLQGQRDLALSNPPLIFPLSSRVPKYCFKLSSEWWSSFQLLLKNDEKNLQDSLSPIDNKTINDFNPETFVYINKNLWKTLKSLYGCKDKRKIFIINNAPVKPTIFSRVVLNSVREKILLVPKSLSVKKYLKLAAKKLRINRKDYIFLNVMGNGYRLELNQFEKTLDQISLDLHSEVFVKPRDIHPVPALLIREEEGEDDDFHQALRDSRNVELNSNRTGFDRVCDHRFSDFELQKIREVREVTFLAFEPKFVLAVKSLRRIKQDLESIEKCFNGK
jgi:hypothetical protein